MTDWDTDEKCVKCGHKAMVMHGDKMYCYECWRDVVKLDMKKEDFEQEFYCED